MSDTGAEHTPLWLLPTPWHSGVPIDLSYMGLMVCQSAVTLIRMWLELCEACGVPGERAGTLLLWVSSREAQKRISKGQ